MELTFLGAAETVTGSKYLVEASGKRILVDCGLFQGPKELRNHNWAPLPFDPAGLDAVVLTHAHIDHTGYLPVLFKQGFRGPIYSSPATQALCGILLPDSGHLQEEEARYANKRGFSKHQPALPLYTEEDAKACLRLFRPVPFGQKLSLSDGLSFHFRPVGHILGASFIVMTDGKTTILFSGDLGRPVDPIMNAPTPPERCDYLVVESTYGDRLHPADDSAHMLGEVVRRTAERRGVILIPAFAVGRAQMVLHLVAGLKNRKAIPDIPVYLNSPMAIDASDLFCQFSQDHHLSSEECTEMCSVAKYVRSVEESKALNNRTGPMIIISASGMATGGRILHHLKSFAPDPKNTILLTGYQAFGTRGRSLLDGAEKVKIHGDEVPIKAEVVCIDTLSAHADKKEILQWLQQSPAPPKKVFITHGEPRAQSALKAAIAEKLGWEADIPRYLDKVSL